ncbi:uncharacterized protein [Lolium perenne]|uniref:uncharacterized protein n=1 Tax=Lolium perenne TaxID=4522 RepID=UPI0021F5E4FD|nr:uncharacterized protein LOC127338812 [Lolium perenne]
MKWAQAAFLLVALLAAAEGRREKACDTGWQCSGSGFCCNVTIIDYFKAHHFEEFFPRRNDSIAHAGGFWSYQAFIAAAAQFEPRGFGTTGGEETGIKEVAAFLGHVGARTSCGKFYPNPLAWGLCYNREMSPEQMLAHENASYIPLEQTSHAHLRILYLSPSRTRRGLKSYSGVVMAIFTLGEFVSSAPIPTSNRSTSLISLERADASASKASFIILIERGSPSVRRSKRATPLCCAVLLHTLRSFATVAQFLLYHVSISVFNKIVFVVIAQFF